MKYSIHFLWVAAILLAAIAFIIWEGGLLWWEAVIMLTIFASAVILSYYSGFGKKKDQ